MTDTQHTPEPWVRLNHLTQCYETPDGTKVAAEVADNVECMVDVLHIADIREKQRASIDAARAALEGTK